MSRSTQSAMAWFEWWRAACAGEANGRICWAHSLNVKQAKQPILQVRRPAQHLPARPLDALRGDGELWLHARVLVAGTAMLRAAGASSHGPSKRRNRKLSWAGGVQLHAL